MNPRGVGIANIISHTELAATAATIIHGYSHTATDSLIPSMHQIIKQLSHPNLHRHHIKGNVLQSIAKAIHHRPFISTKSNLTQVLLAINMLTLFLEN